MNSSTACAEKIMTAIPLTVRILWHRLQTMTPAAVTPSQFGLLTLLRQQPLTSGELARQWGVSAPTMSKMVSLLGQHGWITRDEDPNDRRRKIISLTTTGQELQSQVYGTVHQSVAGSLDDLNEGQRAQIISALDLLLESLTASSQ